MRLVTWNCFRGRLEERVERLRPFNADVIALQEVGRPQLPFMEAVWSGRSDAQGVGVAAPTFSIEKIEVGLPATALLVQVNAPLPLMVLNLWSVPDPTYEAFVMNAAKVCAGQPHPVVVMGDLNSSAQAAKWRKRHLEVVRVLGEELGVTSAYHAFHNVPHGEEPQSTHYFRWNAQGQWHIDYCFVPESWKGMIRDVQVGGFEEWPDSDHRPLVVDLDV